MSIDPETKKAQDIVESFAKDFIEKIDAEMGEQWRKENLCFLFGFGAQYKKGDKDNQGVWSFISGSSHTVIDTMASAIDRMATMAAAQSSVSKKDAIFNIWKDLLRSLIGGESLPGGTLDKSPPSAYTK